MEDETLANVIELKRADIVLSTYEKSKESREVWMLVRDMEKLTLGNDDVLYRHTTDKKNWFPPKKKTDNTSFHRATGHLGQDCTLQLVKDQFY